MRFGETTRCKDGRGGDWRNTVYKITGDGNLFLSNYEIVQGLLNNHSVSVSVDKNRRNKGKFWKTQCV